MNYIVREFRVGDRHDAELLAAMWNASDAGWPWGWTRGVPETAERILDRTQKIDRIAIYVVEIDGEIVGYGDLEQTRGRDDSAYLSTLNVRPDLHGKGLGKALVLKILERTIEKGFRQLTIGTWAGNRKSVPLYKKTGFFWVPDTSVWMQNYIPTAISMPIASDFFDKHDWYSCFKRELESVPDDIEWNGIKAFPYRFEKDGDLFAMWIDKQAEAPTAIETNDIYIACTTGKEDIVCGLEYKLTWVVINKKETPMQVALMAKGEEGISLNVVDNLLVEDKAIIEKVFSISPDIKPKERGMPSHQIRSTLLLNSVPVSLGTAVNPVQPVEIQFGSRMVVQGKPDEKVSVKLKSNLDFTVNGELLIDPHPSLKFDRLSAPFTIEPKSWTSCDFHLLINDAGAFTTKMRAICPHELNPEIPSLTTRSKPVTFLTQPFDSVYAWHDEENKAITVESPTMWAYIRLRGGDIYIHERLSGRQLCEYSAPELGPPFPGWHDVPPNYSYRLEQANGRASVTIIFPSDNAPGMIVERTVTVGAGNFIRFDHQILNTTRLSQKFKLRCEADCHLHDRITLPLKDGMLHAKIEGWGGFPLYDRDLSKKPEDYSESWSAMEESGLVVGMVWGKCDERDGMSLQLDLPEIPPQTHYNTEPFYLVAGQGNWEMVRQLWRWLKQPGTVREIHKPFTYPVLDASFTTSPLIIAGSEIDTELTIHNRRGKMLNGDWRIESPQLRICPSSGSIADINIGKPYTRKVNATISDLTPRIEKSRILINDDVATHEFPAPAIILGDASKSVDFAINDDKSDITVNNGYFSYTVSPEFLGSITALMSNGINHVSTSYPKAVPFLWMSLWYGGIHPFLEWAGNTRFMNEKFTGEQVKHTGRQGIQWYGVKVNCDIQHKDNRWLRMETEYLTTGGSNLLAVVHRLINKTDAPQGANSGVSFWLAPGVKNNAVYYMQRQPIYEKGASSTDQELVLQRRQHREYELDVTCKKWTAFEKKGIVFAIISTHPEASINVELHKDNLSFFSVEKWDDLEPKESKESISWLAICKSIEEAQDYQALTEIWELP